MNKKIFMLIVTGFVLLAFASLSSAQYYGGYYGNPYEDRYDYSSYSSVRSSGGFGGGETILKKYDKLTTSEWIDGSYVKTTAYVQTTTKTPHYGYGPYGSYRYGPWYQKYYSYPSNSYPRTYYVHDYKPEQYRYSW